MKEDKKKKSFWQRLREKYRISVINEVTLNERWHLHLSWWGVIVSLGVLFLLAMGLFSLVIFYTPIKHYLPGYQEDLSPQILQQSARVDSLGTTLELQRQYLDIIKQVVAGEVNVDSVNSMDSLQIIMQEELLETKSQITEDFIAEYEANEKENITLFDRNKNSAITSLFIPAKGTIVRSFSEKERQYGIHIQTANKTNVFSVLDGRVVYVNHEMNNVYTIIIKHATYTSIYKGMGQALKQVGDVVRKGENIGIMHNGTLDFELWEDMRAINPETVIAF